jgi:DNA adenine methylase
MDIKYIIFFNINYYIIMSLHIIPYSGSKRLDIKFFKNYLPNKISHIVEPFGGSGYLSLYLFSINNNLKCHINDIDDKLINFFNQIKANFDYIIDEYNKIISLKPSKEEYLKIIDEYKNNYDSFDKNKKAILFLFYTKYSSFFRKGLYPESDKRKRNFLIDKTKKEIFKNWLKNTTFTNLNYDVVIEQYKNKNKKQKIFIFFDPPYLDSFNSYSVYLGKKTDENNIIIDNTKIFLDILHYLKNKNYNSMFIINSNSIIDFIFKKYIVDKYDKTYQMTKKKTSHNIICNYETTLN